MNRWLIRIRRHDRPWGELKLDAPEAELAPLLMRFPDTEGFRCYVFRCRESRRFLEATPTGIRVVAVEHSEEPWASPCSTALA